MADNSKRLELKEFCFLARAPKLLEKFLASSYFLVYKLLKFVSANLTVLSMTGYKTNGFFEIPTL